MDPSRKRKNPAAQAALLVIALLFLTVREAYGYLDPGAVSLFFQTLIAALLGGLLVVKRYWQQIKSAVRSLFPSKSEHDRP